MCNYIYIPSVSIDSLFYGEKENWISYLIVAEGNVVKTTQTAIKFFRKERYRNSIPIANKNYDLWWINFIKLIVSYMHYMKNLSFKTV